MGTEEGSTVPSALMRITGVGLCAFTGSIKKSVETSKNIKSRNVRAVLGFNSFPILLCKMFDLSLTAGRAVGAGLCSIRFCRVKLNH